MATTLIITNDFPPRIGGIESFVSDLCDLLDHDVVVYTSGSAEATDRHRPFPVIRDGTLLLPTPRVGRSASALLRFHGSTRVVFGAAAPLGLLAPVLREAGAQRIVALTHGHETWWATLPLTRGLLRRVGDGCDHLTAISDYTTGRIALALSQPARQALRRLSPPVDTAVFTPAPGLARSAPRRCVAVGRFVPQKGFDVLLSAWTQVLASRPTDSPPLELVLIGDGPQRRQLQRQVTDQRLFASVRFTGPLQRDRLVRELQQAQLFALPVRTRLTGPFGLGDGLNPEGLGLAALEAAACGLPVVIGRSGGAPETVRDGVTGYVVDPAGPAELAGRIAELLADPIRAATMGRAGRELVLQRFDAHRTRTVLRDLLALG